MEAVFQRVEAIRMRAVEIDTRAQVGQRTERCSGGRKNPSAERIRQRVEGREEIVLRGDEAGGAAESVLAAVEEISLREAPETAADHGIRAEPISGAESRLKLVIIGLRESAGLSVDAREQDHSRNLELAGRQNLLKGLHSGVVGIGRIREDRRIR